MAKTTPFDKHVKEYEQWFIDHHYIFQSELNIIRQMLETWDACVEIGVGSGLFASSLGIEKGVDPSAMMREKAGESGVNVIAGAAEELPFETVSISSVLMVTVVCFLDDIVRAFNEVHRVLKPGGNFIIGFIDRDSPVGRLYDGHKSESLFYQDARFYSTEELIQCLEETGFKVDRIVQTLFGALEDINEVQNSKEGYGEGCFVVMKSCKV